MPRISRYNRDTHHMEWIDASDEEHAAWLADRRAKAAAAPAGRGAKGGKRASGRPSNDPAGAIPTADTLEDAAGAAIRGAAKSARSASGPKPSAGPLTPVLGLLSRLGAIGLVRASAALTAGKHPMTPPEAVSVAAPALRIVDRELGKRVKWTPKGGPNARDLEQIGTGVVTYALRAMFGTVAMPGPAQNPTQAPENHPAGIGPQPFDADVPTPAVPDAASDVADDGDLFSGSEPVGKGAGGLTRGAPSLVPVAAGGDRQLAGPPGAVRGVPEAVWNAVSTPEIGLAEVMG